MNKQKLIEIGNNFGVSRKNTEKIILKQTGLSKEQFFLVEDVDVPGELLLIIEENFRRVSFGYPLEYILESAEFYGLDFFVDKRCLIPRNDTEILVEKAITEIEDSLNSGIKDKFLYIDVGTGSGAIPISIVDNVGHSINNTYALDISREALDIAEINVSNHNFQDKITTICSDLLEGIFPHILEQKNIIITANLPYIKNNDYGNIDGEVILHEPALALYGGKKTGFELYEKLINDIFKIKEITVSDRIVLFIEIGFDQRQTAEEFLKKKHLKYNIFKDNGNIERCIKIEF